MEKLGPNIHVCLSFFSSPRPVPCRLGSSPTFLGPRFGLRLAPLSPHQAARLVRCVPPFLRAHNEWVADAPPTPFCRRHLSLTAPCLAQNTSLSSLHGLREVPTASFPRRSSNPGVKRADPPFFSFFLFFFVVCSPSLSPFNAKVYTLGLLRSPKRDAARVPLFLRDPRTQSLPFCRVFYINCCVVQGKPRSEAVLCLRPAILLWR